MPSPQLASVLRVSVRKLDVLWHDLECGSYREDLALWHTLAGVTGGPVLDVGAGTGRVSLDLAARGVAVVALDAEPSLLAALERRAAGLPVETVVADAREFALGRRFPLILVPMQTLQLFGGAYGRAAILRRALEHLEPGGLLAAAVADALDCFDADHEVPPPPDASEIDGGTTPTSWSAWRTRVSARRLTDSRSSADGASRGRGGRRAPRPGVGRRDRSRSAHRRVRDGRSAVRARDPGVPRDDGGRPARAMIAWRS